MQTSFAGATCWRWSTACRALLDLADGAAGLRRRTRSRSSRRRTEYRLRKAKERAHIVEGLLQGARHDRRDHRPDPRRRTTPTRPAHGLHGDAVRVHRDPGQPHPRHAAAPARRSSRARSCATSSTSCRRRSPSSSRSSPSDAKLRGVIKDELAAIREKYGDERRTRDHHRHRRARRPRPHRRRRGRRRAVAARATSRRSPADAFRTQGRGGKGVRGGNLRDEDYVEHLLTTTAHSYLLFFSNRGRVYRLRAHEIPMKERTARGTALVNLIALAARRAHRGDHRHPHLRGRRVPVLRDAATAW